MKRFVLFLTMALLVLGSCAAAAETNLTDGVEFLDNPYSGAYVNDGTEGYGDRLYNQGDHAVGDQGAEIRVPVEAFLPCYLELEVMGNWGKATAQSFGHESHVSGTPTQFSLAFYPGIGGFVGSDWNLLPASRFSENAEVAPGADVFIKGCDVFTAKMYSNLNYGYSLTVVGKGLTRNATAGLSSAPLLPIEGRAKVEVGDFSGYINTTAKAWGEIPFDTTGADAVWAPALGTPNATTHTTIWHQFRVPYSRKYVAGMYTGAMVFSAHTL